MANLIYLASPYSHNSAAVRLARYLAARFVTITEIKAGTAIFSPIVYGHDMETQIGTAFEPWRAINDAMIEKCDEVWVLCLDGWQQSRGVRYEIEFASALEKPIKYFSAAGRMLNANH